MEGACEDFLSTKGRRRDGGRRRHGGRRDGSADPEPAWGCAPWTRLQRLPEHGRSPPRGALSPGPPPPEPPPLSVALGNQVPEEEGRWGGG